MLVKVIIHPEDLKQLRVTSEGVRHKKKTCVKFSKCLTHCMEGDRASEVSDRAAPYLVDIYKDIYNCCFYNINILLLWSASFIQLSNTPLPSSSPIQ